MEQKSMQKNPERQANSKPNMTGIPIQMKLDFESGSGQSFDDVQVHYNSEKPARLGALAYTQGTQVYIGPGQEQYLPHELGHVVQQKAGLVRPTRFENGLQFNDDPALERQADHIMEWGGVLPLSSRPEAVIQRAPGPPGVGIELETNSIKMRLKSPPTDEKGRLETSWKGKQMADFAYDGVEWAVTIDTTSFNPFAEVWEFTTEIVVDGTTLRLEQDPTTIKTIGEDIRRTLLDNWNTIPGALVRINGCELQKGKVDSNLQIGSIGNDGQEITDTWGEANWEEQTYLSVQVTCAMPLDKVYDLQNSNGLKSKLNSGSTYDLSEYKFAKSGELQPERRQKEGKEVHAFLLLLAQAFGEAHDPKQSMPLMPRTSLGKIFMMLTPEQRNDILKILNNPNIQVPGVGDGALEKIKNAMMGDGSRVIGDSDPVSFKAYKEYLEKLNNGEEQTTGDLIAKHPEALGIGKLRDKTETDLDGKGEFPIFEFRQIGGCTLEELPDFLGKINDEIIRVLKAPPA